MYLDSSRLDTAKKMAAAIVRKELAELRMSTDALNAATKASMIAVSHALKKTTTVVNAGGVATVQPSLGTIPGQSAHVATSQSTSHSGRSGNVAVVKSLNGTFKQVLIKQEKLIRKERKDKGHARGPRSSACADKPCLWSSPGPHLTTRPLLKKDDDCS